MRRLIRQEDLFLNPIVQLALTNKEKFPDDFIAWLKDNVHIWLAFSGQARSVIRRGHAHYSARTIIEYLRHHRATRQIAVGEEWKLNDKNTPYLARLFALNYPEHEKLFEFRVTKKVHTSDEVLG